MRLKICGLTTLEQRRKRGDLIETYKILTGKSGLKPDKFFQPDQNHNRGHHLKLFKRRPTTHIQAAFRDRPIDDWNNLDEETVSAESTQVFKERLAAFGY